MGRLWFWDTHLYPILETCYHAVSSDYCSFWTSHDKVENLMTTFRPDCADLKFSQVNAENA